MNILPRTNLVLTQEQTSKVERVKRAKYICDTCLPKNDSKPVALFLGERMHPVSKSHYFILFYQEGSLYISNGQPCVDIPWTGLLLPSDTVIYSASHHDFFQHEHYFVDGGRYYMRCGGPDLSVVETVTIKVVNDHLEVIDDY